MGWRLHMTCFLLFVTTHLLLLAAELGFNVYVMTQMYIGSDYPGFVVILGLQIVSSVAVQCLSYYWLDLSTTAFSERVKITVLHVLQFGLPWRYIRLLTGESNISVKKELYKSMLLRLLQIFTCTIPIAIFNTYLIVVPLRTFASPTTSVLMLAAIWSLLSSCWSLITYRKDPEYCITLQTLFSWPGSLFKYLWRIGELSVRILIIALFAGLYGYWVLLVLSLHWVTMFLVGLLQQYLWNVEICGEWRNIKSNLLTSYVHTFCYMNNSKTKTKYSFICYYLIMALENITLLVLWILYDDRSHLHVPVAAAIGGCYIIAVVSAVIYYNCFHMKLSQAICKQPDTIFIQQCINCRLSCCAKHNMKLQRPLPTWSVEIGDKTTVHRCDILPQFINSQYVHDQDDQSFPTCYSYASSTCDSTMYEEGIYSDLETTRYTEDTEYSDYIWDDYDLNQKRFPSIPEEGNNKEMPKDGKQSPERSDSGFSASYSNGSKTGQPKNKANMVFVKQGKINVFTGAMAAPEDATRTGSLILKKTKQRKHRKFGLPQENTQCQCQTCGSVYQAKVFTDNHNQINSKSPKHKNNRNIQTNSTGAHGQSDQGDTSRHTCDAAEQRTGCSIIEQNEITVQNHGVSESNHEDVFI